MVPPKAKLPLTEQRNYLRIDKWVGDKIYHTYDQAGLPRKQRKAAEFSIQTGSPMKVRSSSSSSSCESTPSPLSPASIGSPERIRILHPRYL
ncbi:MAG: hypothetical protein V2I33_20765 [Kangiellaceae bacterium]|nr:hypothetical protein [Kangiellaceae bacterium]